MLGSRLRRRNESCKHPKSERTEFEGKFGFGIAVEIGKYESISPSWSPCPSQCSRKNVKTGNIAGKSPGKAVETRSCELLNVHKKTKSVGVTEHVKVKTSDIKVPSFRKRLFRYVERCDYGKKAERRGAVQALAYVTARKYRLGLAKSSVDSARVIKHTQPLLRRRREDACVGGDDPLAITEV